MPLAVLVLLVIAAALALEPFARAQTRKLLDGLDGARADFSEVHVTLFPLRYRITHLKVREVPPKTKEPVFYADELAVNIKWDRLVTGHLVGSVQARGMKVVLHQPAEGTESRLPPIEKVIPFRAQLDRAHVDAGEVLYVWVHKKNQPSLWFHNIEATLENVASRPDMMEGPMQLSARGKVQRSGLMTVHVTANPYATPLSFSGTAKVSDFDPSEMNGLIADTQGVKLTPGRFNMEMSFECRKGRLRGWIDANVHGSDVTSAEDNLGSEFKALLAKISMKVSSPTEGTQPSGRIEVSDNLFDPKLQFWPTLEKVVENGLLLGLEESLKRKASGKKPAEPEKQKRTDLKSAK